MTRLTASLVLLVVLTAGSALSQQRDDTPVLSVRTDLVTLAVTVVDRHGAVVSGLRPEHFAVYDNGERQAIDVFSSEALPATLGLLLDSSGSMRGRREQLTAVVDAFGRLATEGDEIFTLGFSEAVWPWRGPVPAQGMTALYDAIDRGLDYVDRGTHDRKVLVLVSDGGDNASGGSLEAVMERARRSNAAVYSVTFFDPDNRDARPQVVKQLTRETGGRTFTVRTGADVTSAFARIAQEIRSGYTIGFVPTDSATAGFRSIGVLVDARDDRSLTARTRAGYYAEPSRAPIR